MEERLAIIADDFTGAADSGVKLAEGGRACALVASLAEIASLSAWAEVIAFDAESRSLPPPRAAEAVRAAVDELRAAGFGRFFKKIDSTLRGNLGAEIGAALQAARCELAIVAPSAPRNGRTVVDGLCLVAGAPLGESEYARGIFGGPASSVAEVIARQSGLPIASLHLAEVRRGETPLAQAIGLARAHGAAIVVVDAQSSEDLAVIAGAARIVTDRMSPLFVGSSGLAEAIALRMALGKGPTAAPRGPAPGFSPPPLASGPALFVVGSRSGVAQRQVAELLSEGRLIQAQIDPEAALASPERERRRIEAEVGVYRPEASLLLRVATGGRSDGCGADGGSAARESSIAAFLGQTAGWIFERIQAGLVVATGGDTAASVVRSIGLGALRLERELFPGVVLSSGVAGASPDPIALVTKAGGFGDEKTLLRIDRWWRGERRPFLRRTTG